MTKEIEQEVWRDLKGRGGNSVSSLGRIRREAWTDERGWHRAAQILTPTFRFRQKEQTRDKVGVVRIVGGRTPAWVQVPQLVAEGFLPGYDPSFHDVVPIDGNAANVRADNLRLVPRFAAKVGKKLAEVSQ